MIVNGKWKAIPFGNVGQLMNYRIDWFNEAGVKEFPDTWDGLLEAGIKLKKAGHPFGFELGHGFGDNHGWLYPLLWSYGAREVDNDGKTVAIDSAETARAVDFCREFYQKTMFEDVLGWTDVSNNKAYLSEQISCTNNAESILYIAKKDFPDIGKVTGQAQNPKGPTGQRFHILAPWSHAIFTHTPDVKAAKDFLVWLMDPKQVAGWYDRGQLLRAVPAHVRQRAAVDRRTAQSAVSRFPGDLASAGLACPDQPPAIGKRRQIRRRRHVRQSLCRQIHQGGDRRRIRAIEADLQAGLIVSATTLRAPLNPQPKRQACVAGPSGRPCSAG